MAGHVYDDPKVTVGGDDLTPWATSAAITDNRMNTQATTFGSTGPESYPSQKSSGNTATVSFVQSFVADESHAIVNAALGAKVAVVIAPADTAASPANPEYSGMALITEYTPVTGAAGELIQVDVTFLVDGRWTVTTS